MCFFFLKEKGETGVLGVLGGWGVFKKRGGGVGGVGSISVTLIYLCAEVGSLSWPGLDTAVARRPHSARSRERARPGTATLS